MNKTNVAGYGAAIAMALAWSAPSVAQRQIISGAASNSNVNGDTTQSAVSLTAGALVGTTLEGTETRVLTDFGVNKAFARGTATAETTVSSAWLDTFTASGPASGAIRMQLSFTIDGLAALGAGAPEFNYKVYALRGGDWTLNGVSGDNTGARFAAITAGSDYDDLFLQRAAGAGFQQIDMDEAAAAVTNLSAVAGQPGAFQSEASYLEAEDAYRVITYNAQGGFYTAGYFYEDRWRSGTINQASGNTIFYNAGTPLANQLAGVRNTLEANYGILDAAALCDQALGGCPSNNVWGPTTLTLAFDVLAGQSFTLAAWLYADDIGLGTFDFFNTARLTGLTAQAASGEAVQITSASGALQALPGGGFGYPAALDGAVPEPATWATMIGGFGAIGGALRRRRRSAEFA